MRSLKDIGREARYIRIIDYVADFFYQHGRQTPTFVTQGGNTDKFIDVSEEIIKIADHYTQEGMIGYLQEQNLERTLSQIIMDQDAYSCSEEEVMRVLDSLYEDISHFGLSDDVKELFHISFERESSFPPFPYLIGNWVEENAQEMNYFAQPHYDYRTVKKRVRTKFIGASIFSTEDDDESYSDKYMEERYVSGYKSNVKLPYVHILIRATPKTKNLSEVRYFIAPIVSISGIRVFFGGAKYSLIDWSNRRISGRLNYQSSEFTIKSGRDWGDFIQNIENDFQNSVETPIRDQWQIPTSQANDEQNSA